MPTAPKRMIRKVNEKAWASRRSTAGRQWYNSPVWLHMRAMHLADHPYCVHCLQEGKPMGQAQPLHPHVDHVVPHAGQWDRFTDLSNLQTLCPMHHSRKTIKETAVR